MLASQIPIKFPIPWANGAGPGYIRAIPISSQIGIQPGAASLTDGWPPLTFLPPGSGGIPPFGQDDNGIKNQITQWLWWLTAGGPVKWDSAYSTAIGGYPQGALVQSSTTLGLFWQSTIDNNTTNPDAAGANWIGFSFTGEATRIETTSSGPFTTSASDGAVGVLRSGTVGDLSTTLPIGVGPGKVIKYVDFAGNFFDFPLTVFAPAGMTFQKNRNSIKLNVNSQIATFQFFGTNLWSASFL